MHLPRDLTLRTQTRSDIHQTSGLAFAIDVVLTDAESKAMRCVLDTKYKRVDMPSTSDIAQIVAYAQARHTN